MLASPAVGRNPARDRDAGTPNLIDAGAIAAWLRLLVAQDRVVELRAVRKEAGAEVGYFDHAHLDDMARCGYALSESGDYKGVYVTLNPLDSALLVRAPCRMVRGARPSTDLDVTRRRWMLIDVDPQRDGGVSATDAEKGSARKRALEIGKYLRAEGWPIPVLADSGNGYHVLVRVDLPRDDGGLVQRALRALAGRFDGAGVNIDRLVFNPSRLTKLYGTMARKGPATAERPHRLSRVVYAPPEVCAVPAELLERLAGSAPVVPTGAVAVSGGGAAVPVTSTVPLADRLKRAERYIAKVPGPSRDRAATTRPSPSPACSSRTLT
jgi:hypothetical protein